MRSLATLLATVLALLAVPGTAAAQPAGCTTDATVTWAADWDTVLVDGARVAVPGCADGERVGLQLLGAAGEINDEPLLATVVDEEAVFDLTPLGVGVEPVTGVRVLLHGTDGPVLVEIVVEQRYFNAPGQEQRGLRRSDVLIAPVGGRYAVPDPGPAYATVPCASVGVSTEGTVAEGTGVFDVIGGGRHLACHRRDAGGGTGPRPTPPQVLDGTLTREDVDVVGSGTADAGRGNVDAGGGTAHDTSVLGVTQRRRDGASLALTGPELVVLLAIAGGLLVAGASFLDARRRDGASVPRR